MKLKLNFSTFLLATILALTQTACMFGGYSPVIDFIIPGSPTHAHESATFENRFRLREHTYSANFLMRSVNIQVILWIDKGTATYNLLDPNGEVRWQGEVTSGEHFNEARGFGAVTGEWTIQIDLNSASGRYDVYWFGNYE